MSIVKELAGFVAGIEYASLPPNAREHLKMHLLDTIGAMLAGPRTLEGEAIGKLAGKFAVQHSSPVIGYSFQANLVTSVMAECAATRSTEVDDIHLESCTTPGAVVVPIALSLANAGYFSSSEDFMTAIVVGYELLIRFGMAINGPKVLYHGVWPTYLGAALGSAALTARALKLNRQQTASAISTALLMSTGVSGRFRIAPSPRCLTLGVAAQNGIIAAFSAQAGFSGDEDLLERTRGKIYGLFVSPEKMSNNLGQRFLIDETGMKPYPIARQALAAVEMFQDIVFTHGINPESINEVCVSVPRWFISLIDHPELPDNRLESIVSVKYQIALAALRPVNLLDVKREPLVMDSRINDLIKKIQVRSSAKLGRCYPSIWPAEVEIKAKGKKYVGEMLYPKGDHRNRFTWDEVALKFRRIAGPIIGEAATGQLTDSIKGLDAGSSLVNLFTLLG